MFLRGLKVSVKENEVSTEKNSSRMLEQRLKRAVQKGLPGLFPSRKREMSLKGTECSLLFGVMYVKPSVLKSHKCGRIRD